MMDHTGCTLHIDIPVSGNFDQSAAHKALDDVLPGIDIQFNQSKSCEIAIPTRVLVPPDHILAGIGEQNPKTGEWVSTTQRNIFMTASEVLMTLNA
jgi:hypothetical protein